MNSLISERIKVLKGIAPGADIFAGGATSDAINLKGYRRAMVLISADSASTGVATYKVQSCDSDGGNGADMPFKHRSIADGAVEAVSAVANVAAGSTVAHTAGDHEIHMLEVEAADLPQSQTFIKLVAAETVDAAIIGEVLVILMDPSYADVAPGTPALT